MLPQYLVSSYLYMPLFTKLYYARVKRLLSFLSRFCLIHISYFRVIKCYRRMISKEMVPVVVNFIQNKQLLRQYNTNIGDYFSG